LDGEEACCEAKDAACWSRMEGSRWHAAARGARLDEQCAGGAQGRATRVLMRTTRRRVIVATRESVEAKYAECPNTKVIAEKCSCTAEDCPRRKNCCACVEWHRDFAGTPLPHCLRDLDTVQWQRRNP